MWRLLISRAHPDSGGDHDLFIWTMATRDVVCGGELGGEIPRREHRERERETPRPRGASTPNADRVPFDAAFDKAASFSSLTEQAISLAESGAVGEPYA